MTQFAIESERSKGNIVINIIGRIRHLTPAKWEFISNRHTFLLERNSDGDFLYCFRKQRAK